MRHLTSILLFLPACLWAQVLEYTWPNTPCVQMIHCDTGCTACNVPEASGALLVGSNLSGVGVEICPRPTVPGDNALDIVGWPWSPSIDHRVVISGMSLIPGELDSIVIVHGADPDGPQRVQVSLSLNGGAPVELGDMSTSADQELVFTGLGSLAPAEGQAFGTFQLTFRAYQGNGGAWSLDAVRVVMGPVNSATAVPEWERTIGRTGGPGHDLLGRDLAPSSAGLHVGPGRVVLMP